MDPEDDPRIHASAVSPEDPDPLDQFMTLVHQEALAEQSRAGQDRVLAPEDNDGTPGMDESDGSPTDRPSTKKDDLEQMLAAAARKAQQRELLAVDHSLITYRPFRKDFYRETADLARMTAAEVEEWRTAVHNVRVRGRGCPKPVMNWAQCGLPSRVMDVLRTQGYAGPTPIQAQAIPVIMGGRDVIGVAKTGSGKTVAFLLPLLRHVLDQPGCGTGDGPVALVMTPTRELAIQTYLETKKFTAQTALRAVCAYGGAPIKEQIADLKRGAEIVVCTPGRMIDLLLANSGKVTNLERVTYLVLDEADRMFDMGFGPQVLRIVGNIRPDKQAVLFSATFPRQMEALARKVLQGRPVEIVVGAHSTVCGDVTQQVEVLEDDRKFIRLLTILGEWYETQTQRILIFVDRQDSADALMKDLWRRSYPSHALHGGKEQAERDQAIADFKNGVVPVLVATSIAARGLDVKELGLVVNYDCPNHMEDYVHRVGRTGRAGRKGHAVTFVTPEQDRFAGDIVRALKASAVPVPDDLSRLAESFQLKLRAGTVQAAGSGFGGRGLERIDEERSRSIRAQKQALLEDGDEDKDDSESEEHDDRKDAKAKARAKKPHQQQALEALRFRANLLDQPEAVQQAAQAARTVAQGIEERVARLAPIARYDPMAEVSARYQTLSASASMSANKPFGEVIPVFDPKLMAARPGDPEPEAREWLCEIDINDFPQSARLRIVNKDTLKAVCDAAGGRVVVLVKGQHQPPGKAVGPERRLHLRVEGESKGVVETARQEIRQILVQMTLGSGERVDLTKLTMQ